jgi:hypothetical protein
MTATKRVVYSVDSEVLGRFNAAFHGRERSRMIERLMLRALDAEEDEVAAAAARVENDPEMAGRRDVSDWADANAVEMLNRL